MRILIYKEIKNIKKYSTLLKNGVYRFNSTFDKVYMNHSKNIITFSEKGQPWKKRFLNLIRKLIYFRGFIIKSEEKKFDGLELVIPSSKYGYKIFSDNSVMTLYFDEVLNKKNCENKKKIEKMFNTPDTIEVSKNYIVEKKIAFNDFDKNTAVSYLLSSSSADAHTDSITYNCLDKEKAEFIKNLFSSLDYLSNVTIATQHCDMWSGNLLYDGKKFYVIDYENVSQKYFLYDFFTFIYSEYYINRDISLLDNYFNGNYNDDLLGYSNRFNVDFDFDKLKSYFVTFLVIFFIDRFSGLKNKSIIKEFNKLSFILRRYGLVV